MGPKDIKNLNFEQLDEQIFEAAKLMEMLSHPARLRILCMMLGGEKKRSKTGHRCWPFTTRHVASPQEAARFKFCHDAPRQANNLLCAQG